VGDSGGEIGDSAPIRIGVCDYSDYESGDCDIGDIITYELGCVC
jgi:hypothetical protein